MLSLGSLAFLNPWVLAGLVALPILWWLLRAIPPSPRTQTFAGVRLLLGLEDEERQTDKTPWWLLLLRCLAIAAALLGLAQPVSNLTQRLSGNGPLLVLMDQGWASAPEWTERVATARTILEEAGQNNRQIVFWAAAMSAEPPTVSAQAALETLASLQPMPFEPNHKAVLDALTTDARGVSEVVWLHDGLARTETSELMAALSGFGPLRLIGPDAPAAAVTPPRLEEGALVADVLTAGPLQPQQVIAFARADDGGERRIAAVDVPEPVDGRSTVTFNLPPQLQGTVTRLALANRPSAGGAAFADGAIRRVSSGLIALQSDGAIANLTSATHYVTKAALPWSDMSRGSLVDLLAMDPAVIVMPDYADLPDAERVSLTEWIEDGGVLIRFAGPRLAASIGAQGFGAVNTDDPLLPVRLRRGGRVLGGALAWSTPRSLGPFDDDSPFRGLEIPEEVDVKTQVLAEPSPDLAGKVWASLDDGTPLVTAKLLGSGRVVLFHVSADAEWSSLPLSGLFVEMLGRLMRMAPGRAAGMPDAEAMQDTVWRAETLMNVDGEPRPAPTTLDAVPGTRLRAGGPDATLLPGVYVKASGRTGAGDPASIVVNLTSDETELAPFPEAPAGVVTETLGGSKPQRYGALLLALATLLVVADIIGTLLVSGRLGSRTKAAALSIAIFAVAALPHDAMAQSAENDKLAVAATAETSIGFVKTGNPRIDQVSERGIAGLRMALSQRTAVEPGPPIGVLPGEDELSFFPVLYMPLIADYLPDDRKLSALARYIQDGGMLIIDTQNGSSGFGGASAMQMRQIARALKLPPLAPVQADHVITRTFYLLTTFPGRWRGGQVWTEAAPPRPDAGDANADIPQFDRVDDNVSPVIVGSADWASAWAVDESGLPLYPIGRPGDRQRELALRFGVNAVMYALTGNYKSDQVHAPAVLKRLGQ